MKYHIWTEGCQMNVADSRRVASAVERLGYTYTESIEEADVIILNTCVVRQSAENRAYGHLYALRALKETNPGLVINLMGCLVGLNGDEKLRLRFPFVDVFSPPSDPGPLVVYLTLHRARVCEAPQIENRFALMDGDMLLPERNRGRLVSAYVPIVYGCSHACTFCVIPFRRGGERSRQVNEIVTDVRALVAQGVKEVTLLGQIVDQYGKDRPEGQNLAGLLGTLHEVDGLQRIRFLTSHPNYFNDELLNVVSELPKVMPHIEIPIQSGNDDILKRMKRGYTKTDYLRVIEKIRAKIPVVSIATDIIVGFPGETEAQFMDSFRLISDLKLDVAHLARYSPRAGTIAARHMNDNVPADEKMRRFRLLEEIQEKTVTEINSSYLDQRVDVLFEEKVKGRWKGRTPTNKLVFVESEADLRGRIQPVIVTRSGPWSMQARISL